MRANLAQFCLLALVNALVGGMVGQEQTVLPLLAQQDFHLTGYIFLLSYVLAFGITKAATNYLAGTWSDRFGRKPVLLAGWLIAIPVPLLLIWAPSWGWVVVANMLLGINQGLTWSTTVVMKIDLVGPRQRGLPRRRRSRRPRLPSPPVSASRCACTKPIPRPTDPISVGRHAQSDERAGVRPRLAHTIRSA